MLQHLHQIPPDPIFKVLTEFNADARTDKINLGIGIYTTPDGKPYVFSSVQKAAKNLDRTNFNYLPFQGHQKFLEQTARLYLGESIDPDQIAMQQTCGGTHACRLLNDLVARDFVYYLKDEKKIDRTPPKLLVGSPTWSNHFALFDKFETQTFDHLDAEGKINFSSYKKALENANQHDILLLHGGGTHNPTGRNLSLEQIKSLLPIIKERSVFVFVDFAYLGFGVSIEEDRKMLQYLYENLDHLAFGVSYSKNASLYRHRLGGLFIKSKPDRKTLMESNLQNLIRESISNLPSYGAEIMNSIFENYQDEWIQEVEAVQKDIHARRNALADLLPEKFQRLRIGQGMFDLLPLSKPQVKKLKTDYAVYMPENGRINFGSLQVGQIDDLAKKLNSVG